MDIRVIRWRVPGVGFAFNRKELSDMLTRAKMTGTNEFYAVMNNGTEHKLKLS